MDIAIQLTNMSTKDKQTAVFMIQQHNTPIIVENARKAALTPPQAAVPLLPSSTNAEIKTSYETVFIGIDQAAHASYGQQEAQANGQDKPEFKVALANATPAGRDRALAQLLIP